MDISHRLQNVKLLILEVDGIMTDGRTWLDNNGQWRRKFSVRDTMGLRRLRRSGYQIAVLSLSHDSDVRDHMAMVGVDFFFEDCVDKFPVYREILEKTGLKSEEIALMSFDPDDKALLQDVGLGITVPSAGFELRGAVHLTTSHEGGDGAVREVCNLVYQHGFFTGRVKQAAVGR